jgi:hypothetical protein
MYAQEVSSNLPSGWRLPIKQELESSWRQKSPTKFVIVKGDFDGDGKVDLAQILINPSRRSFGLFVLLSSSEKWELLGDGDLRSFERFGIDQVQPGRYETACGKGYGDYACANSEPDFLVLTNKAIDYIYTESSDTIFYWDKHSHKFNKALMSD